MLKKKNNNSVCSVVSTDKISLSSLAVVAINFIVAFSKYNNINPISTDICSFDFLILIVLLFLNSIDIFNAHKEFTSGYIKVERMASLASLILSAVVICVAAGTWIKFWSIDCSSLIFEGRLSIIHTLTQNKVFNIDFVFGFYFASSAMQFVARLFKFKIDKDIKKEILG